MSAEDNLRDALIEAFRKEFYESRFWPEGTARPDPTWLTDIALNVVKDWTAEPTLAGLKIVSDPDVPMGRIVFRHADGREDILRL